MNAKIELNDFILPESLPKNYKRLLQAEPALQLYNDIDNELYLHFGNAAHSLTITSPSKQEGKSFISLLLALRSAQAFTEKPTLLIDASSSSNYFQSLIAETQNITLSQVTKENSITSCIHTSNISNLHLCKLSANTKMAQILPHAQLERLATYARAHCYRVVVDTDSAQTNKSYAALTRHFRNTLLVTRYKTTRHDQLQAQIATLRQYQCTILGSILNRRIYSLPAWIYGR